MSEASHAERAGELLAAVDAYSVRVEALDPMEHVQRVVDGSIARGNANVEHTIELATAHALLSIAYSLEAFAAER